jgi:predicted metal-dependent hydrolase
MREALARRFVASKAGWIAEKVAYVRKMEEKLRKAAERGEGPAWPRLSKKQQVAEYEQYKAAALALAQSRLLEFNTAYGFSYKKVSIRSQKGRWGSCSARGNLSFNYKIALLPPRLADYIIVHELCHLGEFNHSRKFWALVARAIADYAEIKKELKRYHL